MYLVHVHEKGRGMVLFIYTPKYINSYLPIEPKVSTVTESFGK